MKRLLAVSILTASLLAAYPNGSRIPAGNAGEPGSGTPCASCHSVTLNPSSGKVTLTLPGGNTYTAGTKQRWTVSVTDANTALRTGFQLTATSGTFTAVTSTTVITSGSKQYVSQSASASTYTFDWTPPATGDTVTVYVAGVATSGTRSTNVYTSSVTLSKAAAATNKPSISASGVVNGASFATGISSGSWVSIMGTNLAPAGVARSWTAAEIVNGKLPTSLDGTSVSINGKPAAIAYVSETQLNVQAPEDSSTGIVSVSVTTSAGGTSDATTANLASAAPGLFRFSPNSYRNVAAVRADGSLVGPADLYGASVTTSPAQPGEWITLYGTGFGKTDPAVTAGYAFAGAAPLATGNGLVIRIGGVQATVQFGGISATGLYQFNIQVPTLNDGEYAVEASAWGSAVPTTQYLAVKR